MYEQQPSGIKDICGFDICEGDKLKVIGDWIPSIDKPEFVCRFQQGAFGIEFDYLGAKRFYAFCQICNTEYVVIPTEYPCPMCEYKGVGVSCYKYEKRK